MYKALPKQRDDLFQLCCASVNATSWESMKTYLLTTKANVVCGVEMHTLGERTAEASQWAKRNGWKSVWEDATPGAAAQVSVGGVAIFVRSHLGLGPPPAGEAKVIKGRVVAALVNSPGTHWFVAYARYLHDSEGLAACNLDILSSIGQHIAAHGRPFICGADFNLSPKILATTTFASELSAQIVHSDVRLGTCFQGATPTTLDYFVISNDLAHGVQSVGVDFQATTSPHRQAWVMFHPCLTSLKALTFRRPAPIPVLQECDGPVPPPPDWTSATYEAEQALKIAKIGNVVEVDEALHKAYESWANTAEIELVGTMQVKVDRLGMRGAMPKLVWKSILPQDSSDRPKGNKLSKVIRWIAARAKELRLASLRVHRSSSRYGQAELVELATAVMHHQPDEVATCPAADESL